MDPFGSISTVFSLVIGLGVAKLLSNFVICFKSRKRIKIDWVPIVWATGIFLTMLQFWWAIIELRVEKATWSLLEFLLFLILILFLYAAASLVLPSVENFHEEPMEQAFRENGKWSLVLLSAYFSLAICINNALFKSPFNSLSFLFNIILVILPLLYFIFQERKWTILITITFAIILLIALWVNSPKIYNEFMPT